MPSMSARVNRWRQWAGETRRKVGDAAVNVGRAFRLVWASHPPSAVLMGVWTVVGSLLPAGQAWVGKLIVDAVGAAIQTRAAPQAGLRAIAPLLAAEFGLLVLQSVIGEARSPTHHTLHPP